MRDEGKDIRKPKFWWLDGVKANTTPLMISLLVRRPVGMEAFLSATTDDDEISDKGCWLAITFF